MHAAHAAAFFRIPSVNSLLSRPFTRQGIPRHHPERKIRWGYFRSVSFIVLYIAAWVAASFLGAILVLACIVGSVALWLRGFVGLFYWGLEEWGRRAIVEEFPTPMPGQEEGVRGLPHQEESSFWREAWENVAKTRANRTQNQHESAHFYVDALLQVYCMELLLYHRVLAQYCFHIQRCHCLKHLPIDHRVCPTYSHTYARINIYVCRMHVVECGLLSYLCCKQF